MSVLDAGRAPDDAGRNGRPDRTSDVVIGLNAVIVAAGEGGPQFLAVRRADPADGDGAERWGLPYGPFDPSLHRTLEIGLRTWVEEETALGLGYVEQLYTFGDQGRDAPTAALGPRAPADARVVSVGYLALTRKDDDEPGHKARWRSFYRAFPWEDHRGGRPAVIADRISPALDHWAERAHSRAQRNRRLERIRLCFGLDDLGWDEEKVLERYELLYEAGALFEARRDRAAAALKAGGPPIEARERPDADLGEAMTSDHRRILATGMTRLRGKLKYRPVVFEMLPQTFTLSELQTLVEALSGLCLHKPNFRRLVEKAGLVEGTGEMTRETGGRPAELFRFRKDVVHERPAPGLRVGVR